MNTIEICAKLKETTYFVNAFTGSEVLHPENSIAVGSAVSISERGDLLTAAHVVTGRLPVRQEDLRDPDVSIVAMRQGGKLIQYKPGVCGPAINSPFIRGPLTIDLALLHPASPQSNVPHLSIHRDPIQIGTQVLMAGFPDDMELPFSFDARLDPDNPEYNSQQVNLRIARQLLMIKSGMIGQRSGVRFSAGSITLAGEVMYIDNEMHTGASGGPVVDVDLRIVGIMTKRAITSVAFKETPDMRVPSGSTVALSPRIIQVWIDKISGG
jgi:hypothetical protein